MGADELESVDGADGVAERLRLFRKEAGLTQVSLAEASGLSLALVQGIEQAKAKAVPPDVVDALADALGVPPHWILDGQRRGREFGWHAYLLNVDIVGFSKQPEWVQIAMVRHVLHEWLAQPVMQGLEPEQDFHLNSTGDGFILALPSSGEKLLPIDLCHSALRLARACQKFVAPALTEAEEAQHQLKIRAGIHVGELVVDRCLYSGAGFGIGVGLNWCTRVAGAAGSGQVLVSEEFVQHMLERLGPREVNRLVYPEIPEDCFEVDVKHGKIAGVRILKGSERSSTGQPGSESALLENIQVDQQLRRALLFIGRSVLKGIGQIADVGADAVSPRLTLWRRRDDCVQALQIRVQLPEDVGDSKELARSSTVYRLHTDSLDEPEGPVARAWVTGECQHLLALPDPEQEQDAYLDALRRQGIPVGKAKGFSRDARTWLCIPLVLFEEPTAVLCIDLLFPLQDEQVAKTLMEQVLLRSSYLLAALVHIRTT